MSDNEKSAQFETLSLDRYLKPVHVWALSLGGILGWGAYVMPATTLIPVAGPVGTIIALLIAGALIAIIAASLHFMMARYRDSGGVFAFARIIFGFDHAFLCAWASVLAYMSIMWANATAFILIARNLLGPVFQFGYLYEVAGYQVYVGEIFVTLVILLVFGLISCANKKIVNIVNTVLAFIMVIGAAVCLAIVVGAGIGDLSNFVPEFAPGTNPAVGVFGIVAMAPWAFLGFESVAFAGGEISFSAKRTFGVLVAAIGAGTFIYVAMAAVTVLGIPAGYDSWMAYFADLGNLSGIDGLPTFHAMSLSLGQAGVLILAITVIASVSTSLISLYRAMNRLIYVLGKERILPARFAKLTPGGVPRNAIYLIMLVSIVVPFVGRAAIGWIVDVTTVSAAIVYGYVCACAFVTARKEGKTVMVVFSIIGLVAAVTFLVYPLVPSIWSVSPLAPASYLILAAWSILGLVFFRMTFNRDRRGRFGKATVVWIFMLFLIFFSSTMWMRQITYDATEDVVEDIGEYYVDEYANRGVELGDVQRIQLEQFLKARTDEMRQTLLNNSLIQMGLLIVALAMMFSIYGLMLNREKRIDSRRVEAEEATKAKTTFLSNMSHDIRTPMNAIIGYTHLARRDGTTLEEANMYLEKIDASSKHLLALINDVLEMSRIESGKMELDPAPANLRRLMDDVRDMFAMQMQEKGIIYTVDAKGVRNEMVMCDVGRLNRVLLNLISNAYKFTPKGGAVAVSLAQVGAPVDGMASYQLRVKDTGIGMTEEFAAKVFEAFERERSTTVNNIQGTGLGTAITKSIVDMMGGSIRVATELGEGTEFVVDVDFRVLTDEEIAKINQAEAAAAEDIDFTGKRILLVEDNEINREIAMLILEDAGFVIEEAENGKVAVDKVAASEPGYYDAVLMDVQMPVMNGYEATQAIRKLDNPGLASVPIIAASANAFSEDVQAARDAGMDAHVAKPLDVPKVMEVLANFVK